MKTFKIPWLLISVFIFPIQVLFAQEPCRVLIQNLEGEYEGKCKKGLANGKGVARGIDTYTGSFKEGLPHGKGTYVWSTGDVYEGEWKEGLREGLGTFTFKMNEKDTVLSGIWEKDRYIGPVIEKPRVVRKYNIDRVNFFRQGDGYQVEIAFYQGGNLAAGLENFMIVGSSGSEYSVGKSVGFQNVSFPFTCTVNYSIWNAFRTQIFDCDLEFEISQPGHWMVKVYNL
ncbi:MAG: hypothetical protein AMS27_12600 [Bacteroides sp. SM23_62_1]|nr:MAG: hypothetical protein AMS27_12600 [Bacteroides sp. SM23_62_1]